MVRALDSEVGAGRHEYCVLEQDILLSKSTGNTPEAVVPSRHDKNCLPGR